jgi:hypothetical protein
VLRHHAAPHGRDYYTQSDTAIYVALDEHTTRLNMLAEIHNQLEAIAMAVDGAP